MIFKIKFSRLTFQTVDSRNWAEDPKNFGTVVVKKNLRRKWQHFERVVEQVVEEPYVAAGFFGVAGSWDVVGVHS